MRQVLVVFLLGSLVLTLASHPNKYSVGRRRIAYPNEGGSKRQVAYLGHALRRDGKAIVHPMGRYALCLYGRWNCRVEKTTAEWGWTLKLPDRVPIALIPAVSSSQAKEAVVNAIEKIRLEKARRVFFFGVHMRRREYFFHHARRELISRGYRERGFRRRKGALLVRFTRNRARH